MRKTVDATTHEYCVNTDYQVFSLYYIVVSNWLILFHCQRHFFSLLVCFLITQWVSESIDELKRASFSREERMTNFTLKKSISCLKPSQATDPFNPPKQTTLTDYRCTHKKAFVCSRRRVCRVLTAALTKEHCEKVRDERIVV